MHARAQYEEAVSIETLAELKTVLASNETWLVHFCVPDVEGCEVFAEGFAPIAEEIVQFGIRVGFVEPSEKNQKMFAGMGVQRVPALKGFFGPTTINPYTKKPHRDSTDYDFGTSMRPASVKRWAYKHMPHAVHQKATGKTLSPLFGSAVASGSEVAVFFTDRDDTSPLLKALSNEFAGRLTIAEVQSSETELTEAYGVTAFPELHVVAPPKPALIDGDVTAGSITKYDGSLRDRAALTAFLEEHALAEAIGGDGGGDGGDDEADARQRRPRGRGGRLSERGRLLRRPYLRRQMRGSSRSCATPTTIRCPATTPRSRPRLKAACTRARCGAPNTKPCAPRTPTPSGSCTRTVPPRGRKRRRPRLRARPQRCVRLRRPCPTARCATSARPR